MNQTTNTRITDVSSFARSDIYALYAEAFRGNVDNKEVLDMLSLPALPQSEEATAFISAFEPAVYDNACSLYEGSYATRDRSAVFEDLVRFYDYFGLARNDDAELPDHVSVQLEFMHFLSFLENRASENSDDIAHIQRAQRDFLKKHLLPLSTKIDEENNSKITTLKVLTQNLKSYIQSDLERLTQY